ncbi:hypothetical protein ACFVKB_44160, partial [Rhodococcus sp. NPDC127530]|uniref:hypothetical protein n=1 Tax=unclassified Rhodococcus (in: high G+C Gram-positive bacteria) TaxID=192944 RepID=UPI0036347935
MPPTPRPPPHSLTWCLGRVMLHRGDPDMTAITAADLFAFGSTLQGNIELFLEYVKGTVALEEIVLPAASMV